MAPTVAAASKLAAEINGLGAGPAGLTAREREIAAFLASGKSNREIAEELVLSERTIETHVHNLLPKLGLQEPDAGRRLGAQGRNRRPNYVEPLSRAASTSPQHGGTPIERNHHVRARRPIPHPAAR